MTMPNFLVIGAAKCGTDSLCNYLNQHPEVYVSQDREPNFFVAEGRPEIPYRGPGDRAALESLNMWVHTLEQYQKLFAGVSTEKAIGEGTAWYIYFEDAPLRIKKHVPDVKLVAVLRNPIDRAYSAYTMLVRDGRETIEDFDKALDAESVRVIQGWEPIWYYTDMGFYTKQLQRYYAQFDAEQIRVILYDDFNAKPALVLRELFRFLGVDECIEPDMSVRTNVSYVPRNFMMHRLVAGQSSAKSLLKAVLPRQVRQSVKQRIVQRNLVRPKPMAPDVRDRLRSVFRDEILELQSVLGRDLSNWLA
jgi:hypothetical protein